MASEDTRQLFVSDEAWQHLVSMAKDSEYIRHTAKNVAGMDAFIEYIILNTELQDSRPQDIKEQDEFMTEVGMAPEWIKYTPRKRRSIRVSNNTLIQACLAAHNLGITSVKPRVGSPTPFDGNKCLSILLEAIGTGWICCIGAQNDAEQ